MNEDKLVPKRRFKEFENSEAWEQRKLGDMAGRYDNLRVPVTASNRIPGVTPYYGANGIQNYVDGFTHNGEFVLIAEDGANDLKNYPVHYVNGKVWVNNHAHVIQALEGISDNKFLKYSFKILKIEPYLVGGGRAKLNANIMMDLVINTPTINEQIKIGEVFSRLDNLITLHQRKLNKLKETKLAYLSEIFPKEGEKYPKLRFDGFSEAWEQRKLGEVVQITMGQSPSSENYTDNPNDHILVQGNADIKSGRVLPRVWTTQVTNQAEKNDLILSVRAPVGDVGKTDYNIVLGRGVAGIKGNEFIFQLLTKMKENGYWRNLSTGSTFESINSNDIKEAYLLIPNNEEQIKIGTFLKTFDNLITLHQRKLKKLENIKKSYLNEIFV